MATEEITKNEEVANKTETTKAKTSPIVVREKEKWTKVSKEMKNKGIHFSRARNVKAGLEVTFNAEEDYHKLHQMLQNEKVQSHTFEPNNYSYSSENILRH